MRIEYYHIPKKILGGSSGGPCRRWDRRMHSLCSIYEVGSQQHKIELEEENWEGYDPNTFQSTIG